jgi:hypothetical protein
MFQSQCSAEAEAGGAKDVTAGQHVLVILPGLVDQI